MQNTNICTTEYLSVKKVAELTGTNFRTLRDRCTKNKYICRTLSSNVGRGGKSYEILITSLEPAMQEVIYKKLAEGSINGVSENCHNITSDFSGAGNALAPVSFDSISIPYIEGENIKESENNALISLETSNDSIGSNNILSFNDVSINAPVSLKNYALTSYGAGNTPQPPLFIPDIPEKAKNIALARVDLINMWESFRKKQSNKQEADTDFVKTYNAKITSLKLFSILGKVSVQTLYRWKKEYKNANNNYCALVPNYNYGNESEIDTTLSDNEQKLILELMLNPKKYSVGKAYDIIRFCLEQRGIEVKSYSSYKRFISKYMRNNFANWIFMREGMKALKDKVMPYIVRDPSVLKVGDVLVADGNVLDFQVQNPFTGRPCRATLVVYMDWRSWDIAGYEIMLSENTQSLCSALRNAIIKLGKMPKICYQDNGRAFRGKFFNGVKNFEECGITGIFQNLGIEPLYSIAYNGRAKIVERFFKEMTSSFSKMLESYIGNNVDNKPAYMKRNEEFHKAIHSGYIPTIEEVKDYFGGWLQFHRSHPCPYNKDGKTIGQVFDEGKGSGVDIDLLDDLMMAQEMRVIQRNGVRLFNTWYYNEALCGIHDKVVVKYSLLDISSVKIYSLRGEFICRATTVMAVHPVASILGDAKDVYSLNQALKQQKRAITKTVKACKAISSKKLQKQVEIIDQKPKKKTENKKPEKVYTINCYSDIEQETKKTYSIF